MRNTSAKQPSCNAQGECRVGARGKTPVRAPNCGADGNCRVGVKGPSPEELARRADRASWEENGRVGPKTRVKPDSIQTFARCFGADVPFLWGHSGENCLAFDGVGVGWIRGDKDYFGVVLTDAGPLLASTHYPEQLRSPTGLAANVF